MTRSQNKEKLTAFLCTLSGAYVLGGGLLSSLGWILPAYRLTDWTGGGIAIKANAALAASLGGGAVLLRMLAPSHRPVIRFLALVVAAIGGATLFQHLSGLDLGIDGLLAVEAPGARATAAPGRMGPPASLSYLLAGIAIALSTGSARQRASSVILGLAVLTLSMVSMVGFAFGAAEMYTIPRLTGIAFQTATMLFALGLGILLTGPDREPLKTLMEPSAAGALARRLVPFALIMPLVVGWLRLLGQRAGLYDAAFGTALRSVVEAVILIAGLWWSVRVICHNEVRRLQAQLQSHDSERRLLSTLDSITDGFLTLDREWRLTFVNREAEHLLGRTRDALIGRILWEVFPESSKSALFSAFHGAVRARQMVEVEAGPLAEPGREFAFRAFPDTEDGLSVYFHDITARKQAEAAALEEERRKDEFLATLAHELRNPLAPIRNSSKLILAPAADAAARQRGAEIIERQVRHMSRLLDDLLDITRITRNRLELRKEWVDITPVVADAIEACRPLIESACHELSVDLPDEPLYVDGDAVRLTQVVSNLINNAAKYTPPRGRISVGVTGNDLEVQVAVVDTGIGIREEMLSRVFGMFFQIPSAVPHAQGGLGIGLALARGIVGLHGGSIEVTSQGEGKGSAFVVTLPRVSELRRDEAGEAQRPEMPLASHRILVVDDLKDSADSLSILLRSLGHEIRTAYGGAEALEVARSFEPEVVLLDLGMPEIDGLEVCRRLRSTTTAGRPVIVALTGWGQPADRRRTQAAGFDHHLVKPVDLTVIQVLLAGVPGAKKRVQSS